MAHAHYRASVDIAHVSDFFTQGCFRLNLHRVESPKLAKDSARIVDEPIKLYHTCNASAGCARSAEQTTQAIQFLGKPTVGEEQHAYNWKRCSISNAEVNRVPGQTPALYRLQELRQPWQAPHALQGENATSAVDPATRPLETLRYAH
jgi:hypothetical protein